MAEGRKPKAAEPCRRRDTGRLEGRSSPSAGDLGASQPAFSLVAEESAREKADLSVGTEPVRTEEQTQQASLGYDAVLVEHLAREAYYDAAWNVEPEAQVMRSHEE